MEPFKKIGFDPKNNYELSMPTGSISLAESVARNVFPEMHRLCQTNSQRETAVVSFTKVDSSPTSCKNSFDSFGPFINESSIPKKEYLISKFFSKNFVREKIASLEEVLEKLKVTLTQFDVILDDYKDVKDIILIKIDDWILNQVKAFIEVYPACKIAECSMLEEQMPLFFKLCFPLFKKNKTDLCRLFSKTLSSVKVTESQALVEVIRKTVEGIIYEQRDNKKWENKWTFERSSSRDAIEYYLSISKPYLPEDSLNNPLDEPLLWDIIFKDERTFRLFMRCTNSLCHFSKKISLFLNALDQKRKDPEAFEDLVRCHYIYIKSNILPRLETLELNPSTKERIENALNAFHLTYPLTVSIPEWIEKNPEIKKLLGNLYSFHNRYSYPKSLPENLIKVPGEKVEWTVFILNKFTNPEYYLDLLRDPECTRYGLNAYLSNRITLNQFVSLCMAWSVVNAYDPAVKSIKIHHCNDYSLRPYFHMLNSEKNDEIIDTALEMTQKFDISEQFVLTIDFDTGYKLIKNPLHSRLMHFFKQEELFLYPNKGRWIIPSFTLMNNFLEACFGPQYAKPIPCLGDFPPRGLAQGLKTGDRPFQISMKNVGHTLRADNLLSLSIQHLSDTTRDPIAPDLWLHDLFHLNVLGAIPLEHRLLFADLALDMSKRALLTKDTLFKNVYHRLVDMQFHEYTYELNKNKKTDFSKAFLKSMKEISFDKEEVILFVIEFLKKSNHPYFSSEYILNHLSNLIKKR